MSTGASPSFPPSDASAILAALADIKEDNHALGERVDTGFAEMRAELAAVKEKAESAGKVALRAQGVATDAMRVASDVTARQTETEAAMVQHAARTTQAAAAIVKANDAQTPLIQQTLDILTLLRKQGPLFLAGAAVLGATLKELLGPLASLFHR
jgi:hypothetical protein